MYKKVHICVLNERPRDQSQVTNRNRLVLSGDSKCIATAESRQMFVWDIVLNQVMKHAWTIVVGYIMVK